MDCPAELCGDCVKIARGRYGPPRRTAWGDSRTASSGYIQRETACPIIDSGPLTRMMPAGFGSLRVAAWCDSTAEPSLLSSPTGACRPTDSSSPSREKGELDIGSAQTAG